VIEKNETQLEILPPEDNNLPAETVERHSHQDQDYDYVRNNLQDIIETGGEALQGILELAQESDHPRAWEVVGQIMRQLAETNKDLIDLQKDMKKIKNEESVKTVTQNAIFMGSTAELQKYLRGQGHLTQKLKDTIKNG
jgi:5-bromo-4-chloroindolyl phosphate hydrolysis protein